MLGQLVRVFVLFCTLAGATTATADEPDQMPFLMERGLDLMFRQLPPEFHGFRDLFDGPVPEFEAPEVLPNGDIILRRKRDSDAPAAQPAPKGQIDL